MALKLVESGGIPAIGKAARAFVAQYDWNQITDEFETTLRRLTERAHGLADSPSGTAPG